jgi:DNA invertase Pin-like site-specific DNA recombinase
MRKTKMPLAYSYLRFSSPEQAKGDSIRRQTEDTDAWCQRNNAQLDTSLSLRDEGVSAFKGKNRENPDVHALAQFLAFVKSGRVPAGSYLVLENLDRLSREEVVPAVNLFTGLLLAGVKVVQLNPGEVIYTAKADMGQIMLAVCELSRGHSESAMKSDRVGKAWANKRKNAETKLVTRRVPGWMKRDADGRAVLDDKGWPVLDPTGAATIRRVYALAGDGLGVGVIAKKLNAEGVPVLGRTTLKGRPVLWSETVVYHLLTTRTVLGEYQRHTGRNSARRPAGDPIADYYPRVIPDDDWHRVQGALKVRKKVGSGRRGTHVNLFAGLLVDATDGGSLTYKHLSTRSSALIPVGAKQGRGTPWSSFLADLFEEAMLSELTEVKVKDVRGDDDAGRKVEVLAGRLAEAEALVKAWAAKMDNPATVDLVAAKLAELNARRAKLAEQLADAQREAASPAAEAWGEFKSLAHLLAADPSDELRLKVRAVLRRCIESVHCIFATAGRRRLAGVQVRFRGSDRHRDYVISYDRFRRGAEAHAWEAESAAWPAQMGDLDFRKPRDAARVRKFLESVGVRRAG